MTEATYQRYLVYQAKHPHTQTLDREAFNDIWHQSLVVEDESHDFIMASILNQKVYVTFIVSDDKTITQSMLKRLEEVSIMNGWSQTWIHFQNPVKTSWYPIEHIHHPTRPGISIKDPHVPWLLEEGFQIHTIEDVYLLDLTQDTSFILDDRIRFYHSNEKEHLKDLIESVHQPDWRNTLENTLNGDLRPLLVAWHNDKMMGFTGPLAVEPSKRGYFAGIQVLEQAKGLGLGKGLFHRLCYELSSRGAHYMTFFTGRKNLAQHIYLSAGARVIHSCYTMYKHNR